MGHLVSQTARPHTRAQYHHLSKARPPPNIVSQASHLKTPPPSPPPPRSLPLLPTKPPLLPSTLLINPIVNLSQQLLPADEAQGVAWASLLRPSTTSSTASASAGPTCNTLPTSSVRISIPAASTTTQDAALHVSPSQSSELMRLLKNGPVLVLVLVRCLMLVVRRVG